MSVINDFLPFCPTDTGTNLESQANYITDTSRTNGNQPGVASAKLNNKALRQSSYVVSQIAQYIANTLAASVLDDNDPATLIAQIQLAFRPAGEITMWGAAAAPSGWHICDGAAISRTTFAVLFGIIGTTFGVGDGSTTFNLPKMNGIFPRGVGTQAIGGVNYTGTLGTVQGDEMQGHVHVISQSNAASGTQTPAALELASGGGSGTYCLTNGTPNAGSTGLSNGDPSDDGVNGTPRYGLETRPANLGLNFIIKL